MPASTFDGEADGTTTGSDVWLHAETTSGASAATRIRNMREFQLE